MVLILQYFFALEDISSRRKLIVVGTFFEGYDDFVNMTNILNVTFVYIKYNKYHIVYFIQHKKLYPSNDDGLRKSKPEKKYTAPIDTDDINTDSFSTKPNKIK